MSVHVDLKAALLRAHEAEREIARHRWDGDASLYVYEADRKRAAQLDPSAVLDAGPGVQVFWVVGAHPSGPRYYRVMRGVILVVAEAIGAIVTDGEIQLVEPTVDARLRSLA